MDCDEFRTLIASLSEGGAIEGPAAEHAQTCASCRRTFERARLLVAKISGLDRAEAPGALDERILSLPRPDPAPRLLPKVAAAALLLVGAGLAVALLWPPRPDYPRLKLQVIVEKETGEEEVEALREEIFGPVMPALTAGRGGGSGSGR